MSTRPPSVATSFLLIAWMHVCTRARGFGAGQRMARRLGQLRSRIEDRELVEQTVRSVVVAAAFYPGRALCLEQSLALYVLLRRRGIDAALRVGVQPVPFSAHAWVEVDGRPVNEREGHVEQLVTFQQVSI